MNVDPHTMSTEPSAEQTLTRIGQTLQEVETVLINASPPTQAEINDILAAHGDFGGIGLLIDQVQFARVDLTPHNPPSRAHQAHMAEEPATLAGFLPLKRPEKT